MNQVPIPRSLSRCLILLAIFAIDTKIVHSSIDTFVVASIRHGKRVSALSLIKVRRLRVHRLPQVGLVSHNTLLLLRLRTVAKARGIRLRVAGGIHMGS